MLPFGHVVYMPLSPSTATTGSFLGPLSSDFSTSSIIPLYNPTFLSSPFSLHSNCIFEKNVHRQILTHKFKRIRDDLHDIQEKKRPKLSSTINSNNNPSTLPKNALMLLHELKPSIEYKLIAQTGPSHRPMFTMAVEFNGQVFEGTAQTKKEAKQAAAEKALRSFSDLTISLSDNQKSEIVTTHNNNVKSNEEPFDLLIQRRKDLQYEEITKEISSDSNEFKIAIIINDQRFIGTGSNKHIAKNKAAEYALEKLFGMCFHNEVGLSIENDSLPKTLPYCRRTLADRIALCIQEKFKELTQNDVRLQRRKVLSGVIRLCNYNLETMEVICITTGTKCMNSSRAIRNGQTLNDCHAEILARRCLIRYCYEQLKSVINDKSNDTIFEKVDQTNRFRLKTAITFHLYISAAPCGDSRLFSLPDITVEKTSSSNVNSSLRKYGGLLRRKIEVSEGTIPILSKTVYEKTGTSDEIVAHGSLSTMSCSDKLCRWNFIGLQGALLSTLIEPIYYTSTIIGSLYHSEHIRRALFSRIEHKVNHIPTPYGLRKPFISDISNLEIRNTSRPPNYAFAWNCIDKKCETIDSFSGLTISREHSLISKIALFGLWMDLMKSIDMKSIPTTYYDAKKIAVDYQTAKIKVNEAFEHCGSGLWVKKSHQQDDFGLSISDPSLSSSTNN